MPCALVFTAVVSTASRFRRERSADSRMAVLPTVQPDITLLLDMEGVIREATLSPSMSGESVDGWLGRPWVEVAGEMGGEKVKRMVDDARVTGISAFRQINQQIGRAHV